MSFVLDASMALAWILKRKDPSEAKLAVDALDALRATGTTVPALWYAEIGNALLLAERQHVIAAADTVSYLANLSIWQIVQDAASPEKYQAQVIHLGRSYGLTAYDATYLELALRRSVPLATFDKQLANATRRAGGRVFGDAP